MAQETFKLQFLDGPRKGEEIPLGDNPTTLGSAPENTIAMDDPAFSSRHLIFFVEDEQVSVEDLGSTSGTLLNQEPLAGRQRLAHSDALQVGEHHIQVVCLTQSFNGEVRRNIFSDPDGIENKFNSEREHKVRHIVTPPPEARPKTSPARHLDSQDEITGVFDFSALQRGNGGDAPHLNPNINDGTRPLFMEEKKNPLVLIGVLSVLVLILLGLVVYALYFKSGPKASDTPTSEFVAPSVAPPATP